MSSEAAAASCVFLYFSYLPAAFFGARLPHEEASCADRRCDLPRAADDFFQQRASWLISGGGLRGCEAHLLCPPLRPAAGLSRRAHWTPVRSRGAGIGYRGVGAIEFTLASHSPLSKRWPASSHSSGSPQRIAWRSAGDGSGVWLRSSTRSMAATHSKRLVDGRATLREIFLPPLPTCATRPAGSEFSLHCTPSRVVPAQRFGIATRHSASSTTQWRFVGELGSGGELV